MSGGTICDDGWSTNDANVACSVLGFASTGEILKKYSCICVDDASDY